MTLLIGPTNLNDATESAAEKEYDEMTKPRHEVKRELLKRLRWNYVPFEGV